MIALSPPFTLQNHFFCCMPPAHALSLKSHLTCSLFWPSRFFKLRFGWDAPRQSHEREKCWTRTRNFFRAPLRFCPACEIIDTARTEIFIQSGILAPLHQKSNSTGITCSNLSTVFLHSIITSHPCKHTLPSFEREDCRVTTQRTRILHLAVRSCIGRCQDARAAPPCNRTIRGASRPRAVSPNSPFFRRLT